MDQIKVILQTYLACGSIKQTTRRLHVSKNTVRTYVRQVQARFADLSLALELDDEAFAALFAGTATRSSNQRQTDFEERLDYFFAELKRVGVTRQLLWEECRQQRPDGYRYSQFCERLNRAAVCKDLTLAMEHQACVQGYRTPYFNLNRLTEQIAIAQADGSLIKWLNRMKKARLIIFDDFGLQPLTHQIKMTILQILEDRYEQSATIICSQLPVARWYEYLDEPTLADAILDRIIPRGHRIELKGKSRRKT